jgi:hypothetical protein
MTAIEKSGIIVVEDGGAMYLLDNDDLRDLSGELVATNSSEGGYEPAPLLAPASGHVGDDEVWYQPLETANLARSLQSARKRGMDNMRIRLPVGNKDRLDAIYRNYPRVTRLKNSKRRGRYQDSGMRTLFEFFDLIKENEIVPGKNAVIQGVIFCHDY